MTDKSKALPTDQDSATVAADENKLFDNAYVKGASEYVKECATPMTIAIQGDWGAGKTTLIELMEKGLRAEADSEKSDAAHARKYCEEIVNVVTIDAWQQSIANPHIDLFEVLLGDVVSKLVGVDLKAVGYASALVSAAAQIVGATAGKGDDSKDDSSFGAILASLFGMEDDSKAESGNDYVSVEDIAMFQASLVEALQQCAEKNGKSEDSRLVVFIDGLDHISPEAATDLMGRIEAYMHCPRCVYVLAVDEDTVFEGARKKFGDKVDEGHKKRFFNKLVQVPLRIPASAYNLDEFVKELLEDDKALSSEFVEVINTLVNEPIPLRIKRYINTMYLYRSVFGGPESAEDGSLAMLLAAVILEAESTQGFDAIADCAQGGEAYFTENLAATLDSLGMGDGIKWAMLPALWGGGADADADSAKRNAFLSWMQKLK